jgi:hypothetical protein
MESCLTPQRSGDNLQDMRHNRRVCGCSLALLLSIAPIGCGVANQKCSTSVVDSVSPGSAVADHLSSSPGDQVQFTATSAPEETPVNSGCAVPAFITKLTSSWSVSDNINVKISSAQDATNGMATCIGATTGAVTVTAFQVTPNTGLSQIVGTATLTCK